MNSKEIYKLAKERRACEEGLDWWKKHNLSLEILISRKSIIKGYWFWVWDCIPEARDDIRHTKEELEKYKNDNESIVREAVAEQGCALKKLKNDENKWVRLTAKQKLKEKENEK